MIFVLRKLVEFENYINIRILIRVFRTILEYQNMRILKYQNIRMTNIVVYENKLLENIGIFEYI